MTLMSSMKKDSSVDVPTENINVWMIESMSQFMQCMEWTFPIQSFIDEHCGIFLNPHTSESCLEYKLIHDAFKRLCDVLLEQFLSDIGIPIETFLTVAMEISQATPTPENQFAITDAVHILEILCSMEDYASFKCMMEKQNLMMELNILQEECCLESTSNDPPSLISAPLHRGSIKYDIYPDEVLVDPCYHQTDHEEEEIMKRTLALSLQEYRRTQHDLEYVEIQHALKLSEEMARILSAGSTCSLEKKKAEEMEAHEIQSNSTPNPSGSPPKDITPSNESTKHSTSTLLPSMTSPSPTLAALSHRSSGFLLKSQNALPQIGENPKSNIHLHIDTKKQKNTSEETILVVENFTDLCNTNFTAEEIARRSEYMKIQKELIVQKNQNTRLYELNQYITEKDKKKKDLEVDTPSPKRLTVPQDMGNHSNGSNLEDSNVEMIRERILVAQRFRADLALTTREARHVSELAKMNQEKKE